MRVRAAIYWATLAGALSGSASSASALCIYNGELYAKTTLAQEFRDSRLIVRGTVLSARNKPFPPDNSDEGWGTSYRVKIEQVFKGKPPPILTDYTERNSGGFYLDVGKEYLLFLISPRREVKAPPGTLMVNYDCGQSRLWAEVPSKDREQLKALSTSGH